MNESLNTSSFTDVEQGFMPWLMSKVEEKLSRSSLGRIVVDGLIREVVLKRSKEYAALEAEENAKFQALHPQPSEPKLEEESPEEQTGVSNPTSTCFSRS